ncbi:OB-fold-containig protein [Enterobacter sp.]|uniref:OB-fold-containig protein n=1 Tax=Enterobacter sp. TaxID=42895 RepID=UPI00296F6007|nr:OB-fold-containig protein [Enterobacter sp.]
MLIFSEYNAPYLFAISFVLLIGLLEIASLLLGNTLSSVIDIHLTDYNCLATGNIGQALHYLNIGHFPALIVICLLAGYFGLSGMLIQHGWVTLWQTHLSNVLLAPASLALSLVAVHYTGRVFAPIIPRDETSAITENDYIGNMAVITGPSATEGNPCEGKFTDKFGQTHYLLLVPEAGKKFIKGDKVLIICQLSPTLYLGELNPWPNIL